MSLRVLFVSNGECSVMRKKERSGVFVGEEKRRIVEKLGAEISRDRPYKALTDFDS